MRNMPPNTHFALKLSVSIIYIGIIVTLSLLPASDFPKVPLFPGVDKVIHVAMYFILAVTLLWAFRETNAARWKLYGFIVTWGLIMEIVQNLMNLGRSFSLLDILANITGAFLGIIVFRALVSKYFV
jgi:VanZ family protein